MHGVVQASGGANSGLRGVKLARPLAGPALAPSPSCACPSTRLFVALQLRDAGALARQLRHRRRQLSIQFVHRAAEGGACGGERGEAGGSAGAHPRPAEALAAPQASSPAAAPAHAPPWRTNRAHPSQLDPSPAVVPLTCPWWGCRTPGTGWGGLLPLAPPSPAVIPASPTNRPSSPTCPWWGCRTPGTGWGASPQGRTRSRTPPARARPAPGRGTAGSTGCRSAGRWGRHAGRGGQGGSAW